MRPESRNRMARAWQARFFLLPIALWPVALARGLDSVSPAGPAQAELGPSDRETPRESRGGPSRATPRLPAPDRADDRRLRRLAPSQPIYSHEAVEQFKLERARRLATMSTDEIDQFARGLDEKLSLVSSPECEETIEWIRETLSVATPAYARRLNLRYPDVLRLTPAQLRRELKSSSGGMWRLAARPRHSSGCVTGAWRCINVSCKLKPSRVSAPSIVRP